MRAEGNSALFLNESADLIVDADVWEAVLRGDKVDLDPLRYPGDFLNFFYIKNCLNFETWMDEKRRDYQSVFLRLVRRKISEALLQGHFTTAVQLTQELFAAHEADEELIRTILSNLLESGQYAEAGVLYQRLKAFLETEYEEEPEEETQKLIEAISRQRNRQKELSGKSMRQFTGRRKELEQLLRFASRRNLSKNMEQEENFAFISGEPGVGKTTLLKELQRQLDPNSFCVFSYVCCQTEAELYLKLWNDFRCQLLQRAEKEGWTLKRSRELLLADFQDYRAFATLYGLEMETLLTSLCREANGKTLVFLIDDIQWLDNSSISLLSRILLHLKHLPVIVIAASRLESRQELRTVKAALMREALLMECRLKRFTVSELEAYIRETCSDLQVGQREMERIYRYTNGNALFLSETVKLMHENNGMDFFGRDTLTSKTVGIIESRLLRLREDERAVLGILSVFPAKATMEELLLIYGENELQLYGILERLLAWQMIEEETEPTEITYRFTHLLIRNYVYGKLSAGRKKQICQKLAAYHELLYQRDRDVKHMPELIYYFDAAQDLYKKYTYKLEYFKAVFSGKEEIWPVVSENFDNRFLTLDLDSSENALIPLAEEIRALGVQETSCKELRMKAEYLIGRFDLSSGDYQRGLNNMRYCLELAESLQDAEYLMDGSLQMVYYAIQVFDLELMKTYVRRCQTLLERFQYKDSVVYGVRRLWALYLIKSGSLKEAKALLYDLISDLKRMQRRYPSALAGLAACNNYLGEIEMKEGQWEEALICVGQAIADTQCGSPVAGIGTSYTNMGIILYHLERYGQASEYFEKARAVFRQISIKWGRAKEEAYAALLDMQLGKGVAARQHYEEACCYVDKDYSPGIEKILTEVYKRLTEQGCSALTLPPKIAPGA